MIFFVEFEIKRQKFIHSSQNLLQFKHKFQPDRFLASDMAIIRSAKRSGLPAVQAYQSLKSFSFDDDSVPYFSS
jgi:hypothetical protein